MKWILAIVVLTLGAATSAAAQDDTATLVGRVTDPTHAVIVGATVLVRNINTDAVRTEKTNKQGDYSVSDLTAGDYDVLITMPNFKEAEEPTVTLQTGQTARFDVTLQIGSVDEKVTVTTEVGALHTDTSDKGDVISPVEISEMPLNGRDFNDLVFNVAGAAPAEEGTKGSEFVFNGVRSDQTNVIVDGLNNTSPRDSTALAAPPLDALQEFQVMTSGYSAEYGRVAGPVINLTIKKGGNTFHGSFFEFVRNDLFDAGNFFDVKGTKSELRRNQFGGTLAGPVKIPHIYNGHDKTFFLLSEESYRQVEGENQIGIVPSLAERMGDFSNSYNTYTGVKFNTPQTLPGGGTAPPLPIYDPNPSHQQVLTNYQLPSNLWDPIAVQLMNSFYPLPSTGFTLPGANNYIVNKKGYTYWDNIVAKVDQQIHAHDEGSIKYLFRHEHTLKPFTGSITDPDSAAATGAWGAILHNLQTLVQINETHIFNPSLINDFRTGLARNVNNERPLDIGTDWGALIGIPGGTTNPSLEDFPYFNVTGYESLGDSTQEPITYTQNVYDTNDTLTLSKGKHTVKFGASRVHTQYFQPTNSEYSGDIGFSGRATLTTGGSNGTEVATAQNGFLEFLAGYNSSADLKVGTVVNHLFDTSWGFFTQDDYKILAGLTLNLGLRYELETLPYEENGQLSNYVPSLQKVVLAAKETPALDATIAAAGATAYTTYAANVGLPKTLIYPNYLRFAPRVGFAWRPSLNDQTVIRGGYGIFYAGSRMTVIREQLAGQFPYATLLTCGANTGSGLSTALAACNYRDTTVNGYDPNAKSAYIQSYNLTVERELPKGLAVELAYTGSKGTHISRLIDINQENIANVTTATGPCSTKGANISCPRAYPFYNGIDFFGFASTSHYNAGTATLRKRFEHGLLFRINFTYARSLDDSSGMNYAGVGGYEGAQNTFDPNAEYGRSDFDRKFVLNGNFVYLLPFKRNFYISGWEMAGSVQADSGTPVTPQLNGPIQDDGEATRPNRTCSGALPNPSVNLWFNTSCFPQVPTTDIGVYGNSGRNIITGPKLVVINLSLSRNFRITDKQKLQFRWEVFNVPNHPNFNTPNDYVDEANVGTITSAKDPRVMQLGAKYQF